mmetsp:Transcript_30007/g.58883  ORF Transcript_30007/g.58883 Transcript_30007/m.58883 type:complete len:258 (+) Transcript_30007:853-1626(+)
MSRLDDIDGVLMTAENTPSHSPIPHHPPVFLRPLSPVDKLVVPRCESLAVISGDLHEVQGLFLRERHERQSRVHTIHHEFFPLTEVVRLSLVLWAVHVVAPERGHLCMLRRRQQNDLPREGLSHNGDVAGPVGALAYRPLRTDAVDHTRHHRDLPLQFLCQLFDCHVVVLTGIQSRSLGCLLPLRQSREQGLCGLMECRAQRSGEHGSQRGLVRDGPVEQLLQLRLLLLSRSMQDKIPRMTLRGRVLACPLHDLFKV